MSVRKRAREAPCWEHFDKMQSRMGTGKVRGREVLVDIITAKCKHCRKEFEHTSSKGTTHLNNHVKSCPGLKAARERTDAFGIHDVDDIDRHDILLVKAMVKYGCRYDMVSDPLFQRYAQSLRPGYQVPSKERMGELLERIFSYERDKLRQVLNGISSRISLSVSEQVPFLYVTASYIDDSWNWQQRIVESLHLGTIYFSCDGFPYDVPYTMRETRPLNIVTMDDKVVDYIWECSSESTGFEKLQSLDARLCKDFSLKDMEITSDIDDDDDDDVIPPLEECLFGDQRSNCYNFRTKCAIKVIAEAAEKGTSLFTDLYNKTNVDLHNPIPSSWTGAYSYVIEMWHENNFLNIRDRLTDEELGRLKVLTECLRYFHDAYELLNEYKYVSSGVFFIKLCEMQSFLKNQPIHKDAEINTMVQEMKRILDEYWGSHKILLSITCFLDPRYKMTKIKEHYSLIFENDGECTKFQAIVIYLMNLYARMKGSNDYSSEECEDELARYLSEECLDDEGRNKNDVLMWWKDNQRFEMLKKMAKDFLGIPLVSTAKASLVHDFIQQEKYRECFFREEKEVFVHSWDFTEEDALCLYDWLNYV